MKDFQIYLQYFWSILVDLTTYIVPPNKESYPNKIQIRIYLCTSENVSSFKNEVIEGLCIVIIMKITSVNGDGDLLKILGILGSKSSSNNYELAGY